MKIREAALAPAFVAAVLQFISVFLFAMTDEQMSLINAALALIATAVTAWSVAAEKGLAVLLGGANVIIQLFAGFGMELATAQQSAIAVLATLIAGYLTRQNVVAPIATSSARVVPERVGPVITRQTGGGLG